MILPGLVSVSFRSLSAQEIITLTAQSSLRGIEWGGDIHVPHGDLAIAREVGERTREAGLEVEAYGSYYRAGGAENNPAFESVLETAQALGTDRIRVWPGGQASAESSSALRESIAADLIRCGELARAAGITVALEYHANTLTDDASSAAALMREVEAAGIRLYWQPPNGMPKDEALANLDQVLPWVDNVHVFQWQVENQQIVRYPLADGSAIWPDYFAKLAAEPKKRWAMLEFIKNDDLSQFSADAQTLRDWLAEF